jgi:hypothetical protein
MNLPPVVTLDKLERELQAMQAPYRIIQSSIDEKFYAVFCCTDCLHKYAMTNPEHFKDCAYACFDGYENAFEIGTIH